MTGCVRSYSQHIRKMCHTHLIAWSQTFPSSQLPIHQLDVIFRILGRYWRMKTTSNSHSFILDVCERLYMCITLDHKRRLDRNENGEKWNINVRTTHKWMWTRARIHCNNRPLYSVMYITVHFSPSIYTLTDIFRFLGELTRSAARYILLKYYWIHSLIHSFVVLKCMQSLSIKELL